MARTYAMPGIPAIPTNVTPEVRRILEPMKEILQSLDLYQRESTIAALQGVGYLDPNGLPAFMPEALDRTPPPAPTGLKASGALANIILDWDATTYNNVALTEVWRAEVDDFSKAVMIGTATKGARVYVDNVGGAATRYYWIRYKSGANVYGPFNAQAGVKGETSADPSYLMDLLTGEGFDTFLYEQRNPNLYINGVYVPLGVYMRDTYIANGTITNAKIGNAAIDDAKIASLSAGKITTGLLDAARIDTDSLFARIAYLDGAIIGQGTITMAKIAGSLYSDNWYGSGGQAGWFIGRNGDAYFQNGYFRGTIYATDGNFSGDISARTFNGKVIDTDNIQERAVTESFTWYSTWPGGYGNGQSDTAHDEYVTIYVTEDSFVYITGRTEYGAVSWSFVITQVDGTALVPSIAVRGGVTGAGDGGLLQYDAEFQYSNRPLSYLPAGTYRIHGSTLTDGNSTTGGGRCDILFFKR